MNKLQTSSKLASVKGFQETNVALPLLNYCFVNASWIALLVFVDTGPTGFLRFGFLQPFTYLKDRRRRANYRNRVTFTIISFF